MNLYQEFQATDEALRHFIETGERGQELAAYKMLYPAYGTYVGGYIPFPGTSIVGAAVGHVWGRLKARSQAKYYQQLDASRNAP